MFVLRQEVWCPMGRRWRWKEEVLEVPTRRRTRAGGGGVRIHSSASARTDQEVTMVHSFNALPNAVPSPEERRAMLLHRLGQVRGGDLQPTR